MINSPVVIFTSPPSPSLAVLAETPAPSLTINCPVTLGSDWYWIDFSSCIDCGICVEVCPVEGAILPEERPDLQKTP
ncbi:MAG: hypothetical protein F6J99_37205 [Moorea sp. SIO4G3]|nr:hypothetical protein [Moorena sp. SIO4G3]